MPPKHRGAHTTHNLEHPPWGEYRTPLDIQGLAAQAICTYAGISQLDREIIGACVWGGIHFHFLLG